MFAETGEAEWFAGLPDGDEDLADPAAGQAVHWLPGEGWVEEWACTSGAVRSR